MLQSNDIITIRRIETFHFRNDNAMTIHMVFISNNLDLNSGFAIEKKKNIVEMC